MRRRPLKETATVGEVIVKVPVTKMFWPEAVRVSSVVDPLLLQSFLSPESRYGPEEEAGYFRGRRDSDVERSSLTAP